MADSNETPAPNDGVIQDAARPRIADQAAALANDLGELLWDGEFAWLMAQEGSHVRALPVHSRAFRRWLIHRIREHGDGRPPSNHQQWSAVTEALDSQAEYTGTSISPAIRVAQQDGVLYIDLGDSGYRCVKVTAAGWEVIPHPADGPYFYRPNRLAALPRPERGGTVDQLCKVFNVKPEDRPLVLAWIVQALRARGPYPVLAADGPAGATKTTLLSALKALTDPTLSSPETPAVTSPRKPPREERDVIAAARNNRVVAFDNVSYLDQWLSDALCRLATGSELGGRAMFTDFDEQVFVASRPVMLNGVADIVRQADLSDRCVRISVRKPQQVTPEATFWLQFVSRFTKSGRAVTLGS